MKPAIPSPSSPSRASRRRFLKRSALFGVPFLLPSHVWSAETSPNERITLGFIGMGKQNGGLLGGFMGKKDAVEVKAVSDVDTNRREAAQKRVAAFTAENDRKGDCAAYADWRELIARKDIDAVVIATPDHWHAIQTTAALAAGKDVYCEKPLVHDVAEAIAVINGVKAHGRVLQCGSMQRSSKEFRVACELVRDGVIGKITHVECQFGEPGVPCDLPQEPAEPGLDWDGWLGPAPFRPYNSVLAPRGLHDHFPMWRLYREYGGGYVTDWGAHHLDIAQWGLGMDESGPVEVLPPESPNATEGAVLRYADGVTVKHLNGGFGVHFFGTEGEVKVNRGRFELIVGGQSRARFVSREDGTSLDSAVLKAEKEFLADAKVKLYATARGDHLGDFLNSMKTRQKPCTHEIIGARSATVCNLMNLAYYHGKKFSWNPADFTFANGTGDPTWLRTEYRGGLKLA